MKPLPVFKIRASEAHYILGGAFNKPTAKQLAELERLQEKADAGKITDKQRETLQELIEKRDAKPVLQDGAITYLQKWMKEQLYERKQEFTNQYVEKGKLCEPEAIQMLAQYIGYIDCIKNEQRAEDEYMTGECDLNMPDIIEEIKNSWDVFTFPLFARELPDAKYYYQVQVYMNLYKKNKAAVNYCLINAPESLIDAEARKAAYAAGYSEVDMDLYLQVRDKLTYDNVPIEFRIKRFEIDRNDKVIEAIKERVLLCREYIESEWNKLFNRQSGGGK